MYILNIGRYRYFLLEKFPSTLTTISLSLLSLRFKNKVDLRHSDLRKYSQYLSNVSRTAVRCPIAPHERARLFRSPGFGKQLQLAGLSLLCRRINNTLLLCGTSLIKHYTILVTYLSVSLSAV